MSSVPHPEVDTHTTTRTSDQPKRSRPPRNLNDRRPRHPGDDPSALPRLRADDQVNVASGSGLGQPRNGDRGRQGSRRTPAGDDGRRHTPFDPAHAEGRPPSRTRPPRGNVTDDSSNSSRAPTRSGGSDRPRQNRARNASKPVDSASITPDSTRGDTRPGPSKGAPRPKRAARFNASLSDPTKTPAVPSPDHRLSHKYGTQAPKEDDLTSILIRALSTPPYPDCAICFSAIHPAQPSWSCSPSLLPVVYGDNLDTDGTSKEKESTQCCWTTFHLKCIKSWAAKSVKDIEEAWRARGEERKGEWRCPGCQLKREVVPRTYLCFCSSTQDPKPPRLATPHSCGNACSRPRDCGHNCPLACHPGPCPSCMITTRTPCHCGKQTISALCSRTSPRKGAKTSVPANLSCGNKCGKTLACGNHACEDICHEGECVPCPVREIARCWCGKEEKEMACGEGEAKDSLILDGETEERWLGRFACTNPCDRSFDCGIHKCSKSCHPSSPTPPVCPRSVSVVTCCPCGKHELADPPSASFFPPGAQLIRSACTDPIPTCTSLCLKPLDGCMHVCSVPCHPGSCPPCSIPLVRPCRCGSTTRETSCSAARAGFGEEEIICDRPCGALRACGRHQCTRMCCPLAALAGPQKGKNRRRGAGTNATTSDVVDEAGWHECELVCGKMLSCGNHRCEERDHKGPCPPCLQSSFEEMICYCGRTVLDPPVACGTRMDCHYPCSREPPPCGHPKAPHSCHEDPTPCPPCVFLTSKHCLCGKKSVDNVRCTQEKVSCGTPCGKLLGCGFHRCERLCHGDACGACTAVCGKLRRLCLPAQHPCTHPCHAPSACPETEPCRAVVTITCQCGRIRQSVPCGRSASNPAGREGTQQLKCTNDCAVAKRNARLAEALGINPDARSDKQVVYSDDLVAFARANVKFLSLAEKAFSDFITSDKKLQVLPHMPESRRKFVHDLATVYRMDTQMVDQEPFRSVQLIRRVDTRIPTPTLSATLPATPSNGLGRLADLRAPPSKWPRAQPTSGTGRGWTAVVAPRPASAGTKTPPGSAPPASALRAHAAATPWRAPHVPHAQIAEPRPVQASASASLVVPDDWEDDV